MVTFTRLFLLNGLRFKNDRSIPARISLKHTVVICTQLTPICHERKQTQKILKKPKDKNTNLKKTNLYKKTETLFLKRPVHLTSYIFQLHHRKMCSINHPQKMFSITRNPISKTTGPSHLISFKITIVKRAHLDTPQGVFY